MQKIRLVVSLALLLCLGLFAGCSSDEKSAESGTPTATAAPSAEKIVFGDGVYGLERGADNVSWRWVGEAGVVRLKNFKQDGVLKMVTEVPMKYFPKTPTITVTLNGEKLDQFAATPGKMEKSYTVPAAKLGASDYAELRVSTDKTFVPKEVEKNSQDPRKLGLTINDLTWDQK